MKFHFRSIAIVFAIFLCALFSSCMTNARTESHGKEDVAYLQIVSSSYGKVDVVLDGEHSFRAETNKSGVRSTSNKHTYKIAPGAHDIEISADGKVIFSKKIFASAGEVKIVEVQ